VIGTLTKKDRKWSAILRSLARLHITSVPVDWTVLYSAYKPKLITLPSYQWRKKRYWIEGPHALYVRTVINKQQAGPLASGSHSRHPFLLSPTLRDQNKKGWQLELSTNDFPYLKDHDILGTLVLAATCSIEYTIAAAHDMRDAAAAAARDYSIPDKYAVGVHLLVENPVLITTTNPPVLKLDIDGTSLPLGARIPFRLLQSSKDNSSNNKDAGSGRGSIFCVPKEVDHSVRDLANQLIDDALADDSRENKKYKRYSGAEVYAHVAKHDYNFGPAHQGVHTAWIESEATKAIGLIEVPEAIADTASDYFLHPSLFDAIFHPSILCRTNDLTLVPTSIQLIFFNKPKSNKMWGVFRSVKTVQKSFFGEFILLDEDKTVIFHIPYFVAKPMNNNTGVGTYEQMWSPTIPTSISTDYFSSKPRKILIFASKNEVGAQVVKRLRSENKKNAVVAVYTSEKTSHTSKDEWQVDPFDEAGMASVIQQTILSGTDIWDAIVYMWPTEEILRESNQKLDMGYKTCAGLLHLLKPMLNSAKVPYPRVIGVTSGAAAVVGEKQLNVAQSTLWGFARSAILEYPDLKLALLDIDPHEDDAAVAASVQHIVAELSSLEGHWDETAYRDERCFKNIMQDASAQPLFQVDASTGIPRIDSVALRHSAASGKLTCTANPETPPLTSAQVRIQAKRIGVLPHILTSSLPPLNSGGFPAVSVYGNVEIGSKSNNLATGDEVIAIGVLPLGNQANVDCNAVIRKPEKWDDNHAATIPAILAVAYYVINYEALVRSRDSVLIVGDLAGLGVAAALLARKLATKVYALVPEESVNHITSLGVKALPLGSWQKTDETPRLDVILSFLDNANDEEHLLLHKQLTTVLKPKARFIGFSKNHILTESTSTFGVSQQVFDLNFFSDREIVSEIVEAISPIFEEFPTAAVHPSVYTVAQISDLDLSALDYASTHIVADFTHIEEISPSNVDYVPNFRSNATYVVVGGLRGLGLATANYAVINGARHIVLVGRSKPDEETQKAISAMKARNAEVIIANGSVTDETFVAGLFQKIKKEMPPLKGVFHSAVVLMDRLVVKHGWSEFAQVLDPKVAGAWLMHKYTLNVPLDFFVLYSSMTSVIGNPGQVAYGAGNAFMDALAQHRRLLGLPTISFNWGGVSDVGVLARASGDVAEMLDKTGNHLLTPDDVLDALGDNLYSSRSGISVLRVDWAKYFAVNTPLPSRIRYKTISTSSTAQGDKQGENSNEAVVLKAIRDAPDDGVQIIEEFLQQYFMKILEFSTPPDVDISIQHLGIESVLAAQMRQHITTQIGVTMPVVWFFSNLTITDLAKRLFGLIPPEELRPPAPKEGSESESLDTTIKEESVDGSPNIIVSDLSFNQFSIYEVSPPGSVDMNLYGYCVFPWMPSKKEYIGQVIQAAVDHHPILKAAYKLKKGDVEKVVQIVDLNAKAHVEYIDATKLTLEEVEAAIVVQANIPFDLTKGHLIKTFIYEREKQMTIAFVFHHLIVDLISCFIFFEDVMNMWASKQRLPKTDVVDHDEFVRWEKQWLASDDGRKAAEFWTSLTKDHNLVKPIELKLKHHNKAVKKSINIFDIHLTPEEHAGLSVLVKQLNTTPFIILWVAYQILLAQGGNSYGPVVMGSVFTTRSNNQVSKRMIGAFVNCLPLINTVYAHNTLREVVETSTPVLSSSMDHAAYHHSLIPKKEGANLLQHMIVDDRVEYNQKFTSLVTKMKFDTVSVNEDTQLKILSESEDSNKIWMQLLLRNDLFDSKAVHTYNTLFKKILSDLLTNPKVAQKRIDKIGY